MKVEMNRSDDGIYRAVKALIVYADKNGGKFCTVNPVQDDKILPGSGVNGKNLAHLFASIGRDPESRTGAMHWKDDRILAEGSSQILWYAPPRKRDIFFSCQNTELMKVSGHEFPWPGLIFLRTTSELYAFAYASSRRPVPESRLYRAPFWNIAESGWVCMPSFARSSERHTPAEWEEIFFRSAFSHESGKNCKEAISKLFPRILKSKTDKFPSDKLVAAGKTVADLLTGKVSR